MSESLDGLGRGRKTHCIHGHKFAEDARWTINHKGYRCRVCRECEKLRARRKRENPERRRLDREKAARYRIAHPDRYRAGWEQVQAKKKQILLGARAGGCIRCGETHPACLDFHHRDGKTTKEGNIAEIRRFSYARIYAEIAKCDVLCANCHRKHHWGERQRQLTISEGD